MKLRNLWRFHRERYRVIRDMNSTLKTLKNYAKAGELVQATRNIEVETSRLQLIALQDPQGLDADFEILQKLGYCYLSQALLNRLEESGVAVSDEVVIDMPQSY